MERMDSPLQGNESCPLCGADTDYFLTSNDRALLRCRQCGVIFVSPRPSEEAIRKLFQDEYIGDDERVSVDFTSMRIASLRREAAIMASLRPEGGRLLDIGTASGAFLQCLPQRPRWQIEGLEPSRFGAAAAARLTGRPVHVGFLRDQGFPGESFDVLTSLDAFMFHPDPCADLAEMTRILKPGGLLAIEIPGLRFRLLKNSGWLCRLIYGVPARLNAGVHLYYYSRETLGRLVSRFGFEEIAACPEQSPVYGPWYMRWANHAYYWTTAALYRLSGGVLSVVPKEFIIFRKVPA